MDALLTIALLALPLSTAAVLVAIVMVAVDPHPWTAVVSGLLAAALALAWVLLSYRDGVDADETGGEGNIYSQVGWLVAAVLSASLRSRCSGGRLGGSWDVLPAGRSCSRERARCERPLERSVAGLGPVSGPQRTARRRARHRLHTDPAAPSSGCSRRWVGLVGD